MADDVRRMSDELARDPASKVFVPLGEALRRQGQLDLALKFTLRGLERHPHMADGHDLLARISADRGDTERAFDEWDMVLRLVPGHLGALKGMGFVCFQREQFADAERFLSQAATADPGDEQVATALRIVRRAQRESGEVPSLAHIPEEEPSAPAQDAPSDMPWEVQAAPMSRDTNVAARRDALAPGMPSADDPRMLFVEVLSDEGQTALLLDRDGLVLGGAYVDHDGRDVAQEVGAELSGVTDAARRATRHLQLGDWTSIVFETEVAVVAMAPSAQDGLLVLATSRATPLGQVRRLLDRCTAHARAWLEGLR